MTVDTVPLLDHLRRLTAPAALASCSDSSLLARFSGQRDQEAFATLVIRHGPMVLNICRRLLGDAHAAEDAFQAAFLVLARKANSVRRGHSLAAWLHGVACRVALNARRAARRNAPHAEPLMVAELSDPRPDPLSQLTVRELLAAVEEEVQHLPKVYCLPVVLCCLEGLSQEEAADRLGWTAGSVKGRLERGRAQLRARLTRRGLTLAAVLAVVEATHGSLRARLSACLVHQTVRAALVFTDLLPSLSPTMSDEVCQLAEHVLKGASMFKRKLVLVLAFLTVLITLGAGALGAFHALDGPGKEDAGQELPPVQVAMDLTDGSRVVGRVADLRELRVRASFGEVSIPIEQVESLQLKDEQGTAIIRFHNGDQLTGILDLKALGDLKLTTALGETTVPLKLLTRCKIEAPPERVKVTARASSTGEATDPNKPFQAADKVSRWNSGGYAPAWIEADLGTSRRLDSITLSPDQDIKGETIHEVWVSNEAIGVDRAKARLAHTFRSETEDHQVLKYTFGLEVSARYVQIRTTSSPTWVSWHSIELKAR